ncbi:hypothetical protein C1645_803773 [Glomus cerebriforme]|uniref:Uncharacterized protein n=1 Tax=Glomus cerebriforme TaxID=658196 RepID=A0A397TFV6_9GLOM|nr:hypothetical protein C1645_803773 [Glomus cerebriforme]
MKHLVNNRLKEKKDNVPNSTSKNPTLVWTDDLLNVVTTSQKSKKSLDDSTSFYKYLLRKSFNPSKFKLIKAQLLNDHKKIVECTTKLLENYPNSYAIRYIRADAYRNLMEYKKAKIDLDHAISLKPKKQEAISFRGVMQCFLRNFDEALNDLNKAINMDDNDGYAYKWRAYCYYKLQHYDKALEDINKTIEHGIAADVFAYIIRADINRELKNYNDGKADLKKALKFKLNKADKVTIICNHGILNLRARCYKEAVEDFTQALTLQPDNVTSLQNRSSAYRMLKKLDKSLEDLEQACLIEPDNVYQYGIRGALYMEMKRWTDAKTNLDLAIQHHPDNIPSYSNRGELLVKLRKYDEAYLDIEKALEIDPKHMVSLQQMIDICRKIGNYSKALTTVNKSLANYPKNINTLLLRSEIYYHQNLFQEALEDLNEAIKLSPKTSTSYCCRSEVYCKLKCYDLALDDINKALSMREANPYAYEIRGNIYRKLRKYSEALNDFNKALELNPLDIGTGDQNTSGYDEGFTLIFKMQGERNFANIYARRGATHFALKNYKEALVDLNQAIELQSEHLLAYKTRACVYQKMDKLDLALDDVDKYIKFREKYNEIGYRKSDSTAGIRIRDCIIEEFEQ